MPMVNAASGVRGMHFTAEPGTFLYFSAQNQDDYGQLTCEIVEDGVVIDQHTSYGAYAIVTCQGTA